MKKAAVVNDTSLELHHGCEIVMKNICQLLKENGIQVVTSHPVGIPWEENLQFLREIKNVDIIVVNGEGTIHHSQDRAKKLVTIARYAKEKLKIPIVLINSTYQDNDSQIEECMRFFDAIYVRESLSQMQLVSAGISSTVVPDMTFYTPFVHDGEKKLNTGGVTDSVFLQVSKDLLQMATERSMVYLPALKDMSLRQFTIKAVLRFWKYHALKAVSLLRWKCSCHVPFDHERSFYYKRDYQRYILMISKLRFLIAARYHSLCFALKTETPFLAIKSNSHKIEGMLQDIGLDDSRLVDFSEVRGKSCPEFTPEELLKIRDYVKSSRLKIEQMFSEIASRI